jgi:hypothetical protein
LVEPAFAAVGQRFLDHPRIADVFTEYLVMFHCIIRTTVPLINAALGQARAMADADAVAAGVATYLEKHVDEERDHDEWLLDDLEVLGMSRTAVVARVPTPTVASLAGSQYYWALHFHPVALLGYFRYMEGSPPTRELIDDLIVRTGHPRAAFRTLAKHGELDPDHKDELDRTVDSLPLEPNHEMVLGYSAMSTAELLTCAFEELLERFETG